jgi:elongation factor Ts
MAEITANTIKDLREKTGVGMMECKKALTESKGDMEEAIKLLRTRGLATAAKKAGRAAKDGLIGSYIHAGGKIGVMIELNCETDFVARTDDYQALVRDLCMHIAASAPRFVGADQVPQSLLDSEKEIYKAQLMQDEKNMKKPENIIAGIVEGRMKKFFEENCLLDQPFVKDPNTLVKDHLAGMIAKLGENIVVRRFTRFALGEDLS